MKKTTAWKFSCACGHVAFSLTVTGFAQCESCQNVYYWNFDGEHWDEAPDVEAQKGSM